jgi:cytochrome c biogenesis protein CcmG/thiol:disulfide interchange protein DsbE
MKKKNLLLLFMVTAFTGTLLGQQAVPSTIIKDLKGKSVDITSYVGHDRPTILTFWASWCAPCKKELDNIADLYPDWQEEFEVELVAVTIDASQDISKARSMVASKAWDYTILSDPNQSLLRALNFQTIPQTFLVNKKGEVVYAHSGYLDGDEYELEEELKKLAK